jgi:hypothetical protein
MIKNHLSRQAKAVRSLPGAGAAQKSVGGS